MRVRAVAIAVTCLGTSLLGAPAATAVDRPVPVLELSCLSLNLNEVGEPGLLYGGLSDPTTGAPIADQTVRIMRADEFTEPVLVAEVQTASDGLFGNLYDAAVNRGTQTYVATFNGNETYAPATVSCQAKVWGTRTEIVADPVPDVSHGADLVVSGRLKTKAGDPIAGVTIRATNTRDFEPAVDLAATTTDANGRFSITAPNVQTGWNSVDVAYAGDHELEPATHDFGTRVKYDTVMTVTGPDQVPDSGEATYVVTLTDGEGTPIPHVMIDTFARQIGRFCCAIPDGGGFTDENGQFIILHKNLALGWPLRVGASYMGNNTYWGSGGSHITKGIPRFRHETDRSSYVAGQRARFLITPTTMGAWPMTKQITLTEDGRDPVSIVPSPWSRKAKFSRVLSRNTVVTVSTGETNYFVAGSKTFAVPVSPRLTQSLAGSYDRSGQTHLVHLTRDPRLDVKVQPNRSGRCVYALVQKYVNGNFRTVQRSDCRHLSTRSKASYELRVSPQPGTKYRLRFESPADDMNAAGSGQWTVLRFTR